MPSALPAPKSLGGLLNHIEDEEETEETGFSALSERAEEISEDIEERQQIVSNCLLKMMKSKKNQRLSRRFEYAARCP